MSNIYVNLESRNNTSSNQHVTLEEVRDPNVVSNPEQYLVGIDRIALRNAFLPVYEHAADLQVKMIRKADSAEDTQSLDFTGLVDSNNLIWNASVFFNVLNAAILDAAVALGIDPQEAPTASYDLSNGKVTIDYSQHANWGDEYHMELNQPLYAIMSSFPVESVDLNSTWYALHTPTGSTSITTAEMINLSPVDKVYVKAFKMPIVSEYISSANSNRASESILTDFDFRGSNIFPLNDISYMATQGIYRFHSMTESGVFNEIKLSFYYKTFNHNSFPLYMIPSGSCAVKLFFKPI